MKLKTNLYKSAEVGPFRFCFYLNEKKVRKGSVDGTYLKISAIGREEQWSMVVPGSFHSFGYLLEALNQGKESQLLNYARLLYLVSMLDTMSQEMDNTLWQAVDNWRSYIQGKGEENAAKVTEAQDMADTELMRGGVAYAEASPKERKRMSEESRKEMKQILDEDKY